MAVKNGVSLNWGGFDKALSKAGHKLGDTQALMESVGDALVSGLGSRLLVGMAHDLVNHVLRARNGRSRNGPRRKAAKP